MSDNPNADLFGGPEENMEEIKVEDQLWNKNPNRCSALKDLWYDELMESVNEIEGVPEEAKMELVFKMTANSVMDMIMESVPDDAALEMSYCFDTFLAVSLTNKKYGSDIFSELHEALSQVNRDDFPDDESYNARLAEFEEQWWHIAQPRLDQRNPNDAVLEMLGKYGLTE